MINTTELLENIFNNLDINTFIKIRTVNKKWNNISYKIIKYIPIVLQSTFILTKHPFSYRICSCSDIDIGLTKNIQKVNKCIFPFIHEYREVKFRLGEEKNIKCELDYRPLEYPSQKFIEKFNFFNKIYYLYVNQNTSQYLITIEPNILYRKNGYIEYLINMTPK